jgi:signal transduction histidine kinase
MDARHPEEGAPVHRDLPGARRLPHLLLTFLFVGAVALLLWMMGYSGSGLWDLSPREACAGAAAVALAALLAARHLALVGALGRARLALGAPSEEQGGAPEDDVKRLRRSQSDLARVTARLLRAQDEERRSIARDLHDGVAQSVVAASIEIGCVRHRIVDSEVSRALDACDQQCKDALQQLRTLSYALYPPGLDEMGLAAAVRWYVRGFEMRTGIVAACDATVVPRLHRAAELALFRVLREALSNVQQHAVAHSVTVSISAEGGRTVLVVRDDGRGLPRAEAPAPVGIGIAGMRERLRRMGGDIEIRSGPRGTELTAFLQLDAGATATPLPSLHPDPGGGAGLR